MTNAPKMIGVFREHFPDIWICTLCEKAGKSFRIESDPAGVHKNAAKKRNSLQMKITRHVDEVHPN